MKTLLREPLFHFLLLGCAFFLVYQLIAENVAGEVAERRQITVSASRLESLAAQFEKTWQRPPRDTELEKLVEGYIREEVYYREALALGLDRDDPVVRRRLQQKLQFLTEDIAVVEDPDERDLQAYLDANPDAYRRPSLYSFTQVFLNPERRGERLQADAMALLAGLRDGSLDAGDVGDPTLLQQRFERESDRYIASTLGRGFVQRLAGLPARGWQGPVESVYGLHLVYLEQRVAGELPALEEVRDAVLRDWSAEQRRQLNEEVYQELRQRYEVVIEPEPGEQEAGAGALRIGS